MQLDRLGNFFIAQQLWCIRQFLKKERGNSEFNMINQYDIIKFLRDHLSSLKDEYDISRLGLFGSFARNEQNDSSDIDIIIEFKEGTKNIYDKKNRIKDFLSSHFQRDVDLCREKYLKPYVKDYLRKEIIYV